MFTSRLATLPAVGWAVAVGSAAAAVVVVDP